MSYKLKEIYNAITPDNIKGIPAINEFMHIFIEILEERSKQSIDISTYNENRKIQTELFKTYLGDLYEVLDSIKDNQKIIDLIDNKNKMFEGLVANYQYINPKVLEEVIDSITDENYLAFKNFREKKGTKKGIEYVYYFISSLVNTPDEAHFVNIKENSPFDLTIEGSLPVEFYYYLIAPLAHPAGFSYDYAQAVSSILIDYYFPHTSTFNVNRLDVNSVDFEDDGITEIRETISFADREVILIETQELVFPKTTRIYFGGAHLGEYLEASNDEGGVRIVYLKGSTGNIIEKYGEYSTLDYDITESVSIHWEGEVEDEIAFAVNSLFSDIFGELSEETITDIHAGDSLGPYVNHVTLPYWDYIGSPGYGKDEYDTPEDTMNTIGADGLYIGRKIIKLDDQPSYVNINWSAIPLKDNNPLETDMTSNVNVNSLNLTGMFTINGKRYLSRLVSDSAIDYINVSGDLYDLGYVITESGGVKSEQWINAFSQNSENFEFLAYSNGVLVE